MKKKEGEVVEGVRKSRKLLENREILMLGDEVRLKRSKEGEWEESKLYMVVTICSQSVENVILISASQI